MARQKDTVTIICYGNKEERTRNDALKFYHECVQHSEGHEQRRYMNILLDLMYGKTVCSDRNGDY